MRAPYNVLVLPYRQVPGGWEFCVMRRSDADYWQGIAGGGEVGEAPPVAAKREAEEEAGIPQSAPYCRLDSMASVSVRHFPAHRFWTEHRYVIPEYCFGVDATGVGIALSDEHTEFLWGSHDTVRDRLHWDSNITALWELAERLVKGDLNLV